MLLQTMNEHPCKESTFRVASKVADEMERSKRPNLQCRILPQVEDGKKHAHSEKSIACGPTQDLSGQFPLLCTVEMIIVDTPFRPKPFAPITVNDAISNPTGNIFR